MRARPPTRALRCAARPLHVVALSAALSMGCAAEQKDSATAEPETEAPGGPSSGVTDDGRFTIAYTTAPSPVPLSDDFSLSWTVSADEPLDNLMLLADAWMPEHGHGMNTTPTTAGTGASWQTDGMLFHMPGDWELVVEVRGVGDTTSLTLPYRCCED